MIQQVLEAVQTTLQADDRLSAVKTYHLVDGMIPGLGPTVSIGCARTRYEPYDNTQDEVMAHIRVYAYMKDIKADRGEANIRALAEQIRYTLLADQYLGGVIDDANVVEITYESDQVNQTDLLHYAVIDYEVKYYESRTNPDSVIGPLVLELDHEINSEEIKVT